MKKSRVTHRP